jgi:predicted nucleotidyltransferase
LPLDPFYANEPGKEAAMSVETRRLIAAITPILQRNRVVSAALFGSVARGEARPDSDLDLLVEFAPDVDLLDAAGLKLELEERLGRPVDLVSRRSLKPRLAPNILADCVPIL